MNAIICGGILKNRYTTIMRTTKAIINLARLKNNYEFIRKSAPTSKVMAVVKANAYGHGMIDVARALRSEGVEFLGVAFADEAVALRQSGDQGDIFIMVPTFGSEAETIAMHDLQPATSSMEFVRDVSHYAQTLGKTVRLHLFIDTGMHRDGVAPSKAVEFIKEASAFPGVIFVGICTHFAASPTNREFSYRQLALFNQTIYTLNKAGYEFEFVHAANSGAIINIPEARFNLVRAGFALYGYPPDECVSDLYEVRPVMSVQSSVVAVRRVAEGECVGYDFGYVATEDMNVATVPVGYGDGYFKTLGNRSSCIIGGKLRPIIGTVCMDELMVDCRDDDVRVGDQVILLGECENERIDAYTIAAWQGTIPYEVTTNISARVPRIYKNS